MKYIDTLTIDKINSLSKAFSKSVSRDVNEILSENLLSTYNGKYMLIWDFRFTNIEKTTIEIGFKSLRIKRGGLWTAVASLDLETGYLYIYTKEKNLETVINKFGNSVIHYFHALISKNTEDDESEGIQISLFSKTDEDFEQKRTILCQEILGGFYSDVKEVFFIVGNEEYGKIIDVSVRYYNKFFELLETKELIENIDVVEYDTLLEVELSKEPEEKGKIATLKSGLKGKKSVNLLKEKEIIKTDQQEGQR